MITAAEPAQGGFCSDDLRRPFSHGPAFHFRKHPTSVAVSNPRVSHISINIRQPLSPNILQKAASMAFDALESAINIYDRSKGLPKTIDPAVQMSGNYSPVPERPVVCNLPVTGSIPTDIEGVYVRNGANPLYEPSAGHHLFDGDGMVHAVRFCNGSVSYSCRLTETNRLIHERELGRAVFPKAIGELHGHSGLARLLLLYARSLFGIVNLSEGSGVANAGLVYFNGRLLAMSEDDLPYHVRILPSGDLQTEGRFDFDSQLTTSMIAHPKIDPVTKELFSLSYDVMKKPHLKYLKFSPDGRKSREVGIDLQQPTMVHDFAITERFVVIPDQQVVFNLQQLFRGGSPVEFDADKVSRFGVMDKNASDASEIEWIDTPGCFCFHLWNAWEDEESHEIVVVGSCMTPADSIFNENGDAKLKATLSEIRLNTETGKSSRKAIIPVEEEDQMNLEVGMVNKNLLGRKTKFAYLAIAEPWPKVSGFSKVNLSTGETLSYLYGEGKYGGEPMYHPCEDTWTGSREEDNGYVIAFVHDEKKWESEVHIVESKSLTVKAIVSLPSRVPYGLHGTFVTSEKLANQI